MNNGRSVVFTSKYMIVSFSSVEWSSGDYNKLSIIIITEVQ